MGELIYDPCFAEKWIEPYRQGLLTQLAMQLAIAIQQSELHEQL
ncbi:hypothetical protein [Nostoc sp. PCC 7524]|nr:hypothetical protein [Nostoc sp. PCC 7524]